MSTLVLRLYPTMLKSSNGAEYKIARMPNERYNVHNIAEYPGQPVFSWLLPTTNGVAIVKPLTEVNETASYFVSKYNEEPTQQNNVGEYFCVTSQRGLVCAHTLKDSATEIVVYWDLDGKNGSTYSVFQSKGKGDGVLQVKNPHGIGIVGNKFIFSGKSSQDDSDGIYHDVHGIYYVDLDNPGTFHKLHVIDQYERFEHKLYFFCIDEQLYVNVLSGTNAKTNEMSFHKCDVSDDKIKVESTKLFTHIGVANFIPLNVSLIGRSFFYLFNHELWKFQFGQFEMVSILKYGNRTSMQVFVVDSQFLDKTSGKLLLPDFSAPVNRSFKYLHSEFALTEIPLEDHVYTDNMASLNLSNGKFAFRDAPFNGGVPATFLRSIKRTNMYGGNLFIESDVGIGVLVVDKKTSKAKFLVLVNSALKKSTMKVFDNVIMCGSRTKMHLLGICEATRKIVVTHVETNLTMHSKTLNIPTGIDFSALQYCGHGFYQNVVYLFNTKTKNQIYRMDLRNGSVHVIYYEYEDLTRVSGLDNTKLYSVSGPNKIWISNNKIHAVIHGHRCETDYSFTAIVTGTLSDQQTGFSNAAQVIYPEDAATIIHLQSVKRSEIAEALKINPNLFSTYKQRKQTQCYRSEDMTALSVSTRGDIQNVRLMIKKTESVNFREVNSTDTFLTFDNVAIMIKSLGQGNVTFSKFTTDAFKNKELFFEVDLYDSEVNFDRMSYRAEASDQLTGNYYYSMMDVNDLRNLRGDTIEGYAFLSSLKPDIAPVLTSPWKDFIVVCIAISLDRMPDLFKEKRDFLNDLYERLSIFDLDSKTVKLIETFKK